MGTKLKELRISKGIDQKTLADYCDVTQCAISNIECGIRKPHVKLAKKIGEFFGLSIEEIWDMFYSDD